MSQKVTASAPGKIILSGEHVVVHGYPALVAAVDKRISIKLTKKNTSFEVSPRESELFVKDALDLLKKHIDINLNGLNISLNSGIPIGRGMGSSAAFAVGISAALLEFFRKQNDLKTVSKLAYELERKYHGNPSGVDIAISTYGRFLWYRKETEEFKTFSEVDIKKKLPQIYLLDTGKPKETTKETIVHVSNLLKSKPGYTLKIFKEIEKTTRALLQYLTGEKNYDFSELIKTNERLLEKLGVVSNSTIGLIKHIEKIGGVAKMSGGGGIKDHSGIILVYHPDKEKLFSFINKSNLKLEKVKFGVKGVQVEKNE